MDEFYSNEDLKAALDVLKSGGLILYPSGVYWGIGCDATNIDATQKIFDLKKSNNISQLQIIVDNLSKLSNYFIEIPPLAWDLTEVSEKPITIICPGAKNLAPNIINADKSIGIRLTFDIFSKALSIKFKKPIVSIPANISDKPVPKNFTEISESIKNGVDYIVGFRQGDNSAYADISVIKLEVNGEIKIIKK